MRGQRPSIFFVNGIFRPNQLACDRFWKKVLPKGECWEWQGKVKGGIDGGYGIIATKNDGDLRAHVISYWMHGGDTKGLCVLHTCDNRKCVNPLHLFLGTRTENMNDKVRKGRQSHSRQKLTAEQVREIRAKYVPYKYSSFRLAREYGVSQETAHAVATKRLYKHIL